MVEHQLLSKVLDEQNFYILNKFNIKDSDFYAIPEVYQFIRDYVGEHNNTPDYRTVVGQCERFEYLPEVVDSYTYLAKAVKNATAKRGAIELLQKDASKKFEELSGTEFVNWLDKGVSHLKDIVNADSYLGANYAISGKERWEQYQENKESRTYKFIPTPYPTLTSYLGGGFELGDYVLLQAYTNRGKSWIASHVGVTSWLNKFGVLHYSPELSLQQQEQRNDTLLGHFNNIQLKTGKLSHEEKYKEFLQGFDEKQEVPYLIKTMEHLPQGLGIDVISADLQANPEIKMVIIDGFNLMAHKGKDGNRNNMSNTSRQLRQLFARHGVVGVVVHQTPTSAEKENKTEDETGTRIVKPPQIHEYSETISVIQDACTVLNFDQHDGVGKILVAKTRTPNVGKDVTLHCDYNHGFVQEASPIDYI